MLTNLKMQKNEENEEFFYKLDVDNNLNSYFQQKNIMIWLLICSISFTTK
jgi:hypothetical protein